jgi:hypothetical protein
LPSAGDQVVDENLVAVEDVVVVHVADVAYRVAHDQFVVELGARRDLAGDHHLVALHQGLARHAALGILREAGVQDAVRNEVRDLVGMALAYGLG